MNFEEFLTGFQQLVAPELVVVALLSALISILYNIISGASIRVTLGATFSFGILGGTCGVISGETFEPIVGALLTGLLGLVSAILSLAYAKNAAATADSSGAANIETFAAPAVVALCLSALIGLIIGRVYQTDWAKYERKYAETKELNERVNMPVAKLSQQYQTCRSALNNSKSCDAILLHSN